MPAALTILNDSNFLQLDGDYKNLLLRHKGTAYTDTAAGGGLSSVQIDLVADSPLIALRCAVDVTLLTAANLGTGSWRFSFLAEGPGGTAIDYFLFDVPQSNPVNYGLELYDASGARVFQAFGKPLRIVDFVSAPVNTGLGNRVYTSDRVYATIFSKVFNYTVSGTQRFISARNLSNGITLSDITWSGPLSLISNSNSAYALMIADVTNY